jgi:phosphatidylglycerol---prolipoprotein diacylglyceryl transferase
MFVNNINPILFSIGPFGVRYYGLVYALGFIIGYLFLWRAIKQKKLKLTEEKLDSYIIWLIIGSIVMARLFDVFVYNLPYYINHFSEFFMIWNGGMSFQGGIIGAIIVTWMFCKKNKIHFYDIADLGVIPTTLTLFLGKLANYTNSELYGKITSPELVPWCVVFQKVDAYCRHPTQIYEAISILILFGILLAYYLYYENKHNPDKHVRYVKGTIFWMFVIGYSVLRFVITFFRDEPLYFGLNVGQWICILTVIISGWFLWKGKHES